jgi:zinc transporter 1/2/3
MLVVALSVHSLVAGLALGIQDSMGNLVVISVAIVAHKATDGFALGISLVRHETPAARSHGLVALLALMTPLGIAVGMTLGALLGRTPDRYFNATALALAAGTFIYIAAVDILQDEFLRPGSRFLKWLFALLGLALTAVLAIWV